MNRGAWWATESVAWALKKWDMTEHAHTHTHTHTHTGYKDKDLIWMEVLIPPVGISSSRLLKLISSINFIY